MILLTRPVPVLLGHDGPSNGVIGKIGFVLPHHRGLWMWHVLPYLPLAYHLVNIQKTMEHHHFSWVNPLYMAAFCTLTFGVTALFPGAGPLKWLPNIFHWLGENPQMMVGGSYPVSLLRFVTRSQIIVLHRATMFARDPQFFVRSTSVIIPRRCHFRYRSPFWGGRPLFQLLHARRSRVSSSSRLMLQVRDGIIRIQKSKRWVGGLRCVVLNHLIHSHIIPYLQS